MPTLDTGSDISNGEEQWALYGGQKRPTLGTGSDVSKGSSGRGLGPGQACDRHRK